MAAEAGGSEPVARTSQTSVVPTTTTQDVTKSLSRPVERLIPGAGKPKEYNTKSLGARLATDGFAAASAGALVAPLITMIDKSVILQE